MNMGSLELTLLGDGHFALDGGAMFGVVPRVLWQKHKTPDEHNRIPMAANSMLVAHGDDLVLIETGIGDKNDAKFQAMFGMDAQATRLPDAIAEAGYDVGDVTHVLLTHLHFDHCGWNTREAQDGRLVPTFPNARYWMQRGEVEHARAPNPRDKASYDPRNWEPLFEAGVVELFEDEGVPMAGVRAIRAPGHNRDMCVVLLGDEAGEEAGDEADGNDATRGETGLWLADLVPTRAHLAYPWVMGFDLYPLETMESKAHWLPRATAGEWVCFFGHETDQPVARLRETRPGRFEAVPLDHVSLDHVSLADVSLDDVSLNRPA